MGPSILSSFKPIEHPRGVVGYRGFCRLGLAEMERGRAAEIDCHEENGVDLAGPGKLCAAGAEVLVNVCIK